VPVVTVEGSASEAFVNAVEALLSIHRSLHAFVQIRHGIFAFGNTIQEAEDTAELVEETSRVAMLIKHGPSGTA
jgi:ribulose-5-phosphate 4-epimerase/fuculose-1-phosphate aldolase